jgi:hypothetical protein
LAVAVKKIIVACVVKGAAIILPKVPEILDPGGREYFYRTRSERFSRPLAQVVPQGKEFEETWSRLQAELAVLTDMLKGPGGESPDPFGVRQARICRFLGRLPSGMVRESRSRELSEDLGGWRR